jgi:hypothetical protein
MSKSPDPKLWRILGRPKDAAFGPTDGILLYEAKYPQYASPSYVFVDDSTCIGIEIEIERVKVNNVHRYPVWTSHPDGSLRDGGTEYVSTPISGSRIGYALNQFFDQMPSGYRFSQRCSVHIHQNCLNMTLKEIAAECMVYSVVEKLLFKFVGNDRDKNNFCVPWYDAKVYGFIKQLCEGQIPSLEAYRYLALNLASLIKFGTLEFRHLNGTDDVNRIITWINLIMCMKQFAMKQKFDYIKDRIESLNTNSQYEYFVHEIFGAWDKHLDKWSLRRDMETPISSTKGAIGTTDFWLKLRTLPPRDSYWYTALTQEKKAIKTTYNIGAPRPAPRFRPARIDRELRAERAPEPALNIDSVLAGLPPATAERMREAHVRNPFFINVQPTEAVQPDPFRIDANFFELDGENP